MAYDTYAASHCAADIQSYGKAPHSLSCAFTHGYISVPSIMKKFQHKGHQQLPGSGGKRAPPRMYD